MQNNPQDVTVSDTSPDITDRFQVETNIEVSEPTEPMEPEAKENSVEEVKTEQEPIEEPPEPKSINPRTLARKAEKERLIRENAELAEKLKQYETKEKQPEPAKRDHSQEPKLEDFEDAFEFMEAKIEHKLFKQQENQRLSIEKQMEDKQVEALAEKVAVFRDEKPDFDEKVNVLVESGMLTPDIEKAILASDMGEKLSYHLANYGADLMTLRGLPKEMLPKAIKHIEAFIAEGATTQEKPKVTRAAPPITPPGVTAKTDRSISSYTQEEIENMPLSEYNKRFKK
jgi:hypothetical protein